MTLDATSGTGSDADTLDARASAGDQPHTSTNDGVVWLGVIGSIVGLLIVGGIWGYSIARPWFQPWDRPLAALIVMTAPYPIALIVSFAGRLNRTLAGVALAGCAIVSAFIVRLGFIGLLHIPAAILLLLGAVFVLSQPLRISNLRVVGGAILTLGAVAMMLSGASSMFRVSAVQECIAYWQLSGGRTLWRPWDGERILVAQETPEGYRDDVEKLGLVCDLNTLTTRKATLGLSQIGSAAFALVAVPVSALGLAFLAPVVLSVALALGATILVPSAGVGLALTVIGSAILVVGHRRKDAAEFELGEDEDDDEPDSKEYVIEESDLDENDPPNGDTAAQEENSRVWQRPS